MSRPLLFSWLLGFLMVLFSCLRREPLREDKKSIVGSAEKDSRRITGNRVGNGHGPRVLQIRNPQSAIRNCGVRNPRSATCNLALVPFVVLALAGASRGDAEELSWARAYEQGTENLRAGDLEQAVRQLRLAVLLHPAHALAGASLAFAREKLQAQLLCEAERCLKKKQLRLAMPLLRRAADLQVPGETREAVIRLLRNYGFESYEGSWHHHDDVIALEKRAMHIARNRRRELELPERFVLHRRARVRVFTDLDLDQDATHLRRLFDRLEEAIAAYRQLFLPFHLDDTWEGLDVVVIERQEDYLSETKSPGTVGIFLPARRASYFAFDHSTSTEEPVTVRVLFHEVCHQLDSKLLSMTRPPPWLQEGLALCFENVRPGKDGRYELHELGTDARRRLAQVCPPGSPRWLGLERLVATRDLRPLHGTPEVHDFYAQAGALVYFLLASSQADPGGPRRRALFYSLVNAARAQGATPEKAVEDFRHLLADAHWTLEDFEKNFVNGLFRMSE